MPINPIKHINKMRYWEPTVASVKPNCNRKDLWELIETKPDFFQKTDEYIATGLAEREMYGPGLEPNFLPKRSADITV